MSHGKIFLFFNQISGEIDFIETEDILDVDSDHSVVLLILSESITKKEIQQISLSLVEYTHDWEVVTCKLAWTMLRHTPRSSAALMLAFRG